MSERAARPSRPRTGVVTGAASGIGAAITRSLLNSGDTVHAVDLMPVHGNVSADRRLVAHRGDVTEQSTAARVLEAAASEGTLDFLVNCAGTAPTGTVEETTQETWENTFRVNVTSVFLFVRASLPFMGRGSAIVNIASEAGLVGTAGATAYAATKAAVVSITKSVALDVAPRGIRSNCVCPGTIETPLTRRYFDSQPDPGAARDADAAAHPLGIGHVDDVAAAAVFLLSEGASYITGHALAVDGGFTCQ